MQNQSLLKGPTFERESVHSDGVTDILLLSDEHRSSFWPKGYMLK